MLTYSIYPRAIIIRPRRCRSTAAYSDQPFPGTICRSVRASVCPVHCGKTADRIRMPFGTISRTGPGMRQVVGFGDRSTKRVTFGGEFGARHCNQWGLTFAATRPSSQITCCYKQVLNAMCSMAYTRRLSAVSPTLCSAHLKTSLSAQWLLCHSSYLHLHCRPFLETLRTPSLSHSSVAPYNSPLGCYVSVSVTLCSTLIYSWWTRIISLTV